MLLAVGLIFGRIRLRDLLPLSLLALAISVFLKVDNGQWIVTGLLARK